MTEKLYYADSMLLSFTARVLSSTRVRDRWEIVLDRTAFFPEGGGQGGDTGTLGGVHVTDTHEINGEVVHWCDAALNAGDTVEGCVNGDLRLARMQIHSGEHIVSGTAHREWGCENTGFHMTERNAVIDFDRELDATQIAALESMANEAVWQDLPVHVLWPTGEELSALSFRQKKELSGEVRLVEIPGVDLCACCAPHVKNTGSVGQIRFISAMRHRGGIRLVMVAGRAALEDARLLHANTETLSRLFSAPREDVSAAGERFAAQKSAAEARCAALEKRFTSLRAAAFPRGFLQRRYGGGRGHSSGYVAGGGLRVAAAMRDLAEELSGRCSGIAGVFAGEGPHWRYVLASKGEDLRTYAKSFNASLRGRGGGSAPMIQGSVNASRAEIEAVFPRTEG